MPTQKYKVIFFTPAQGIMRGHMETAPKDTYWSLFLTRAFKGYHFSRDMVLGAVVNVCAILLQARWHLIATPNWQTHKTLWILAEVIPFAGVLLLLLIFRLLCTPGRVHWDQERKHAEAEGLLRQKINEQDRQVARLERENRTILDSKPRLECQFSCSKEVGFLVTNNGAVADVWASLRIEGPVNGKKQDMFARWAHTHTEKTKIAKGETCRLILALLRMRNQVAVATWEIYHAGGGVIPATYANAIGQNDDAVPDLHLYIRVLSDPDCTQLIGERHVVLHPSTAEELSN